MLVMVCTSRVIADVSRLKGSDVECLIVVNHYMFLSHINIIDMCKELNNFTISRDLPSDQVLQYEG